MASIAEKATSLVEEEPALGEAMATIVELTEDGDGEVEWGDVRDDLTSGQWGRLIETGILVDAVRGFELADREEIKEVLDDAEIEYIVATADDSAPEGTQWSQWDKAAAVGTVGLFAGYAWEPAREFFGGIMDLAIGPMVAIMPMYGVIMVLALFTGLYSTLLQANLMDTEKMGQYQERMKAIQRRRKRAKEEGDEEALERIQQEQLEAMADQLGMFKEQIRPMVWIMFLTIPVFLWLLWAVSARLGSPTYDPAELGEIVFPFASGAMEWSTPIFWYIEPWIVWYFVCSIAFTQVIRKSLNIQMTPTSS